MEINWLGYSCFRITERSMATVVTDPYDHHIVGLDQLKLKADIVTVSNDSPAHNYVNAVKSDPYVISSPGEYEIGGVFITAVQTNGHSKANADDFRNILCMMDINGIIVVHLGALNRVPTRSEIEALGNAAVAFVPIGGGKSLNAAKAAEVINMIEPNIVVPMHYSIPGAVENLDSLEKFLKEMGVTTVQHQPTLKIASAGSLTEETQVIVLDF